MKRALRCIAAGEEELKRQERTVTFEKAVEAALEARKHRRARTLCDFRYVTRRFMKRCPGLARRRVRSITPAECAAYIDAAFETPRQRQKARLTLSGVFSTAMKRGWCSENPVARVEAPRVVENTVPILTPEEAEQLVQAAREYKGSICLPAVGLMLYAGIRPHEVARLRWADVDLPGKRVNIAPQHSKTGGARPVTLLRPALQLLGTAQAPAPQRICPPQWLRHWRAVRQSAGWNRLTRPWPQDVSATASPATTPPNTATCTSCSSRWGTGTPPCCAPVTWLYPPRAPPNDFGGSHHLVARDLSPALQDDGCKGGWPNRAAVCPRKRG